MGKVQVEDNARKFIKQDNVHEKEHDEHLYAALMKRSKVANEIPEWETLRNLAVSYTHLDVYKRQAPYFSAVSALLSPSRLP